MPSLFGVRTTCLPTAMAIGWAVTPLLCLPAQLAIPGHMSEEERRRMKRWAVSSVDGIPCPVSSLA